MNTRVAASERIDGTVTHVRDMDTIEVDGLQIRLNDIDGPELKTNVGRAGKVWMQRLVLRKAVVCDLSGVKTYDRWVGNCFLPSGEDIGVLAIGAGLARDCPRYSGGRYKRHETQQSRAMPVSPYCTGALPCFQRSRLGACLTCRYQQFCHF